MPQLGETVSEGTVTRWLRAQGDTVAANEPLLEIQTDKVSMEIPSLRAGVLVEILVKEGETVPVGAALAWLETDSAVAATQEVAIPAAHAPAEPAQAAAPAPTPAPAATPTPDPSEIDGPRPTPLVRRLLDEAGLRAADVTGTGPGGRILREDVAAAVSARRAPASPATPAVAPGAPPAPRAPQPAAAPARGGTTEPLSPLRKVIADRMVASLRTSAQLTSVVEADVSRVAELRRRAAGSPALGGVKLSFLPFFARAAVEAMSAHPDINASVDTEQGTVTRHDAVHLAIAVDTEAGLLAPVIRDAGQLSLVGIAHAIAEVAARTRARTLSPDDLFGGTFTITNTGSRGALFDTPIINQPQVAILGTGTVVRRPIVVADVETGIEGIAIRSMVYLALTYDHRLVDGAAAAAFLVDVKTRLEDGRFEGELGLPQR
jgi:2-oxoglutarate dehydrogenase E2 component (dihydrolipoamide succinyltransferase)